MLARLWDVLEGNDPDSRYSYLSVTERKHIQKILAETRLKGQEYNIQKPQEIFASGTYGKNVAPYVTSAAHVVNIGNALKSGYK